MPSIMPNRIGLLAASLAAVLSAWAAPDSLAVELPGEDQPAPLTRPSLPQPPFAPPVMSPRALVRLLLRPVRDLCNATAAGRTLADSYAGNFEKGQTCYWLAPFAAAPPADTDKGADRPSLFFTARALDGRVSLVRFKLNADPLDLPRQLGALADLVARMHAKVNWREPDGLDAALRAGRYFEARLAGTHYEFKREYGAVPRYNLIMDIPTEDSAPLPSDRFER